MRFWFSCSDEDCRIERKSPAEEVELVDSAMIAIATAATARSVRDSAPLIVLLLVAQGLQYELSGNTYIHVGIGDTVKEQSGTIELFPER